MTPRAALEGLRWNRPISCTAEEWPAIRHALVETQMKDGTDEITAIICHQEVIRLDELFAEHPPESCRDCGAPFNNANPTKSGLCSACEARDAEV